MQIRGSQVWFGFQVTLLRVSILISWFYYCYECTPTFNQLLAPALQAADLWSCGVLLYAFLTGHCPYQLLPEQLGSSSDSQDPLDAHALFQVLDRIVGSDFQMPSDISPACRCDLFPASDTTS